MENYWDNFYSNKFYCNYNDEFINKESSFAQFVDKFTITNNIKYESFIDLGCGNGRDLTYFINNNTESNYTALDFSTKAYNNLLNKFNDNNKIKIYNLSVLDILPTNNDKAFDLYYCRFLLHSLKIEQIEQFFKNLYNSMHDESILCIETRSIKSIDCDNSDYSIYDYNSGIGETHERLLLSLQYLQDIYIKNNFISIYTDENNDLSIYKNDNPYLIRLILKKNDKSLNQLKSIITKEHIDNTINKKNVFDELVQIFNNHNISYVIFYGNLLGLVRHNLLIIPWDDDIDTYIPDESIEKIISISDLYNFKYEKSSEVLHKLTYKNIIIDIFTKIHFIKSYSMLEEQYFNNFFTDYNIINGYKTPKIYKEVFDIFYNFSDYMNECYIYSHLYNDRWTTNNHTKFKLSLKEINYILPILQLDKF